MNVNVAGVDPGLVHTGVVQLQLFPDSHEWTMTHHLVDGILDAKGNPQVDCDEVVRWLGLAPAEATFIEAYRPRAHYQNDARMGAAVNELKRRIPRATALDNTGVKKVVKPDLMKLLGVWQFKTISHHQDLRAAARIGIYGLLKNQQWNPVLADLVRAHIDGQPWTRV